MQTAQIITSYGRLYIVRDEQGQTFQATTRSKRVDYACGDRVHIKSINAEQVVIEDFLERSSLLYRQDAFKSKLIAANVTQLLIVVAAEPSPNETLVQRALLAAEAAHIEQSRFGRHGQVASCVSVLRRHGLWLQQPQRPRRCRRFAPHTARSQQYFLRPIGHGQIHADQCHPG